MLITCRFCGQDEEHDPAEEYEEYLTCAVCGDHCKLLAGPRKLSPVRFGDLSSLHPPIAHRQCAREQDALKSDDGMKDSPLIRVELYTNRGGRCGKMEMSQLCTKQAGTRSRRGEYSSSQVGLA